MAKLLASQAAWDAANAAIDALRRLRLRPRIRRGAQVPRDAAPARRADRQQPRARVHRPARARDAAVVLMETLPPMRSLMFVPGHRERMVQRALGLGEFDPAGSTSRSSISRTACRRTSKDEARRIVASQRADATSRPLRFVRIQRAVGDAGEADLDAVVRPGLSGIVAPKVRRARGGRVARVRARRARARRVDRAGHGAHRRVDRGRRCAARGAAHREGLGAPGRPHVRVGGFRARPRAAREARR